MRRIGSGALAGALALVLAVAPAAADAPVRSTSTVQRLAATLHEQLRQLALGLPRPAIDLALCTAALADASGSSETLIARVESILATRAAHDGYRSVVRLGEGASCALTAEQASRVAEERGAEALVRITSVVRNGRLFLEGTLLRTDRSLWRDLTGGAQRATIGQLFASARLDAELRFYLHDPAPPLSKRSASVLYESTGDVLAMSAGDVDGDDLDELVVLRRAALDVLGRRAGERRARLLGSLPLDALGRATTLSRDPVGTVTLLPPDGRGARRIALRTSDHAAAVTVAWDGERFAAPEPFGVASGEGPAPSLYPLAGDDALVCGVVPRGRNVFEPRLSPCADPGSSRVEPAFAPFLGRLPRARPAARRERAPHRRVRAGRRSAARERRRALTRPRRLRLGGAGERPRRRRPAQGIARSAASAPGKPDRVTISTVSSEGVRDTWSSRPFAGAVPALAAGDLDGDGVREAVIAELTPGGSRLWVVH